VGEATRILSAIETGDEHATEELLPLVYGELRKLAAQRLAHERPGQTLQATELVHEAFLRLVGADDQQTWNSRGHFFGAAAEAMRRILIDHARKKARPKHGGDRKRIDLARAFPADQAEPHALLAVDEALDRLEARFPEQARLVKLRHYAGCTFEQAARAMDISPATAKRHWAFARVFLYTRLKPQE
jgi:RNA polymerase sigma factor (TIGR02999 family)